MDVSRSELSNFTYTSHTVVRMISTPPLRQDDVTAWPLICISSIGSPEGMICQSPYPIDMYSSHMMLNLSLASTRLKTRTIPIIVDGCVTCGYFIDSTGNI